MRGLRPDEALPPILAGYRPPAGASDELFDPGGRMRPVWRRLIEQLAAWPPEEAARRFARGERYLREAGVFFRQYGEGGGAERAWPLAHVPVLIEEREWTAIAAGLRQRADLLEAVLADLYGPGRLVADGYLPAPLVAQSREWLHPLVGHRPRSGHYLHFVAFELGRGPDGTWWVLGDRTQAPSGAGFALENRVATARVYAELFAEANVHRLAGFFRTFRDALQDLRGESDSRVGILTPGPHNETYFEHAYIARYLGFALLEGEDLAVENGRVMVRTVAGLRPVSVLWRRLDSAFADPLELDPSSRIGTPGFVQAVRQGTVSLVNALGSGLIETRALLAFLPRICKALTGARLILPNIATWWCGQAAERAHVAANMDAMMIGPALSTRLPFDPEEDTVLGAGMRAGARERFAGWLEAEGGRLVGQEVVTLSTTPAFEGGALVPRPMSLRVFLARTPSGWEVMPGGFARIGRTAEPAAIAMQRGGSAADVWVVSERPVAAVSMLPVALPYLRSQPGALPSRAADNLFWLGRYVERAEGLMRLLRAYHVRLAETADPGAPLLAALAEELEPYGTAPEDGLAGLAGTVAQAAASAGHVRDRFSQDGWSALADLAAAARDLSAAGLAPGDDAARALSLLLRQISGFSGLVHDNMYRFIGWRFLEIGRALERALDVTGMLARLADPAAPDGALDLAVELGDSVMSHRRRYAVATNRATVIDLLALDTMNPRSALFQLASLREQVGFLPGAEPAGQLSPLARAVLKAHTDLAIETPETLGSARLAERRAAIAGLWDILAETYFR